MTRIANTNPSKVFDMDVTPANGSDAVKLRICILGVAYDVRESIFHDKERIFHVPTIPAVKAEAKRLREEENCHLVIALTHQSYADDCLLASRTENMLDLVLGGHDHESMVQTTCGHAPYIKADSDLKSLWSITLTISPELTLHSYDLTMHSITSALPSNATVAEAVARWEDRMAGDLGTVVGSSCVDLEARVAKVRREVCLEYIFNI